jgi:hypothetical protein
MALPGEKIFRLYKKDNSPDARSVKQQPGAPAQKGKGTISKAFIKPKELILH